MNAVDALIVAIVLWSAWSGFRRGLIVALLSTVGLVAGVVLGLNLAPVVVRAIGAPTWDVGIGLSTVLVCLALGEYLGTRVGSVVSNRITWVPARAADRAVGLVGQTAVSLLLCWMIAVPLASVPSPGLNSALRNSTLLAQINAVVPAQAQTLSAGLRRLLDDSGFPAILDPLAPTPLIDVQAPDGSLAEGSVQAQAQPSVLKVRSQAAQCAQGMTGTSFVFAPDRVLTNAHVVAGADVVTVQVGREALPATVVLYDPELDLAVLDVPGLDRPALSFDPAPAATGDDAVVVGYPLDGPYTVSPGRIRSEYELHGPDIYESGKVTRQVYILRALVRPGNSGGPVLDSDGEVIGVVFGAAIDDADTGFALTAAQVADSVAAGRSATGPVPTGACTAD